MSFAYLTNLPPDQALTGYLALLSKNGMAPRVESVSAVQALDRVTAAPVYAHICAPHYHACAMDGIAVDARLTFGACETAPVTLMPAQFTVVDTGDPLPAGRDAVVMIEDVVWARGGGVRLYQAAAPWQHVRQIGEDICAGELLLTSHSVVTPAAIGAMIAAGVAELEVIRRPVVGIIPTGDEIVPPTPDPAEGDILEFNSAIFSAMIAQWGGLATTYPIVRDDPARIEAALRQALDACDVVLLGAGSSAGRADYSAQAIGGVGRVFCHGVAMRPGKPVVLGLRGRVPILGVPGYPVSGILVLETFLRPILELLGHRAPHMAACAEAILTQTVVSPLKYRELLRVRMGCVGDRLVATPLSRGSGVVTSFLRADGLLDIPQNTEGFRRGETVRVRLLRPMEELRSALVVIGSHDPLIDELAELLHRRFPRFTVSSAHVGSTGGILAVKRGEAHAAGIHLLDEATGTYNLAALAAHFPEGGVRLVECVGRVQGLMVAPGNPCALRSLADLSRPGLRYVNRQKGSGTRILCDHLCRLAGVDTEKIYGYGREELTHTAVAALIRAGSADAGMGIYSAAKRCGLEFIPVQEEQYDLLIPDSAWDMPMVQALLEVLRSPEFRARLAALGGYTADHPGALRQRLPAR